eukprot:6479726-Amphidinium_carterae.2
MGDWAESEMGRLLAVAAWLLVNSIRNMMAAWKWKGEEHRMRTCRFSPHGLIKASGWKCGQI